MMDGEEDEEEDMDDVYGEEYDNQEESSMNNFPGENVLNPRFAFMQ